MDTGAQMRQEKEPGRLKGRSAAARRGDKWKQPERERLRKKGREGFQSLAECQESKVLGLQSRQGQDQYVQPLRSLHIENSPLNTGC